MTDRRTAGVHAQVLTEQTGTDAQVAAVQVQVLMPTAQTAVLAAALEVQALVPVPWAVSVSDGETAIQVLHEDGLWRPLYLV